MSKASNRSLFFYQGDKLITVKRGEQHHAIFRNADMPLAEVQTGEISGSGILATDDKGSVLSVQDAEGLEGHNFSAYGEDPTLPSMRTTTGFNGEAYESVSASYLLGLGLRSYSPRLRRFCAADNWSPFGKGGLNAYGYCGCDPVNKIDRSGHAPTLNLGLENFTLAFSYKKISSNIARFLTGNELSIFSKIAKEAELIVPRQINKIVYKALTMENLLEFDISQAPYIFKKALETRKYDLTRSTINSSVAIADDFYQNSRSLEDGRRGGMLYRPNGGSDSSSSNRAIRDNRHN